MTAFTLNNTESTLDKIIDKLFQIGSQQDRDEFDYLVYLKEQGVSPREVNVPVPDYFPPNGILTFQEWLDY